MFSLRSASFTRPNDTTAYSAADLVANSTTAGSVSPLTWTAVNNGQGQIAIARVRLHKSDTDAANAQFRLHLYSASPTVVNGDNGALSSNQSANYLGSADVTVSAFSDGCVGIASFSVPILVDFPGSAANLYGLLEVLATYGPAAQEVFTVTLSIETERD